MSKLSCGIVGLPNVGKSTLFNALTRTAAAAASNYPFCTIEPNVGVVPVPDPRLEKLSELSGSKQIIPAQMEFVDIAGLVKGASKGEGLGNQFLHNIRECDAILHVVRCFEEEGVTHVHGGVDPLQDLLVIDLELILADLQMGQNVLGRLQKRARADKKMAEEVALLERILAHLNEEKPLRTFPLTPEEKALMHPYPFLTQKPLLYVGNVSEGDLPEMENAHIEALRNHAEVEGGEVLSICAKLEAEIAQLPQEEQPEFLASVGLEESGLSRLIRASFRLLGLITFFTTGEKETRAWPIREGATAPEAAGTIHSDLQRGFIRAEVIPYAEMVAHGSRNGAKEAGALRIEGKEYLPKDGDVMLFLHS